MTGLKLVLAAAAALALSSSALANDSTASMGAGGLVLERTAGIEMRSEDLYVSARHIRVQYRFFNRTGRDISTIVAFPMPDVTGRPESDIGVSRDDPTQLTPFTTTVEGAPVRTHVEQKAFLGDVEYTATLQGLGIPLAPHLDAAGAALARLPAASVRRLIAMGLVEDRGYVDRGVAHPDLVPLWTLKTTHYWTQVFPAGREIGVDHRYTPAAGGSAGSIVGQTEPGYAEMTADYAARYCTDRAFIDAARRKTRQGLYLTETWVDYILTTGANWAEPIGEFRLVVDKGEPDNLVSFCGTGIRKIGPTTFEMRRRNFTPTRDLSVLILHGERLEQ